MEAKRSPRADVSDRDASPDEKLLVIPPALAFGVRYGQGITARHGIIGDVRRAGLIKADELAGADSSATTVERAPLMKSLWDEYVERQEARIEADRPDPDEIRAKARAEADRIQRDADETVQRMCENAIEEARQRGIAQARSELGVDLATGRLTSDSARAERYFEESLEIVLRLAGSLVGEQLRQRPEVTATLAHNALEASGGASQIRLAAHPQDAARLRSVQHILQEGYTLTIEDDPQLERGSMMLHTELGDVDARLPTVMGTLIAASREVLREALESRAPPSRAVRSQIVGVLARSKTSVPPALSPPRAKG